ncbi:cysteine desulfurase family protein [Alicyclobacillus mengziensis]|uniref:cysteine desulfurase n=1 Tax=Alicyclobacillus mengziensis TaxID=2931921 RepID=A0A9X7VW30_9BACL|nr:cysteine desulfurase family protein [Alicyclobacillus mengziensis]QSO46146.1 cysteine desulfurase [Alicyclobacillus mengziensis]
MIYLDYAATAPIKRDVQAAMLPFLTGEYGNASSIYGLGRRARSAVDTARGTIASFVGARDNELIFTSGGTESIHSALLGAWLAQPDRKHIITSAVEHHAVLHTCHLLEELGVEVTVVKTDGHGQVQVADVLDAIRPDTLLVSVMMVNNELGTVNPIQELALRVREEHPGVLVHSDMVQAVGAFRVNIEGLGVDFASFTAHKLGGPKGIGALYIRQGTPWKSVLRGGSQERERRAGTENVAGIVGFAAAVEWLAQNFDLHQGIIERRSSQLRRGLDQIPDVIFNSPTNAVSQILNLRFVGVRADRLLMRLDIEGVAASAGSACAAGSLDPSHVLLAVGLSTSAARESVRFSLSDETTEAEIEQAIVTIRDTVAWFRSRGD